MDSKTTSMVSTDDVKDKSDLPELYAGNKSCMCDVAERFGITEATLNNKHIHRVMKYLIEVGPVVIQFPFGEEKKKPNKHSEKSSISEEELQEELQEFMEVLTIIINDVTEDLGEIEDARKWIVDALSYNLRTGKKEYALSVVLCYKMLAGKANCSSEKLFLARILSWCVHMEEIGMLAINDIAFIDNSIHYIVKKYFSDCDYYSGILDVISEMSREFLLGQYLDMQSNLLKKPKLQNFTFKKCEAIAQRKASPMLLLTVRLGLFLADYDKEVVKHPVVEGILRKIGMWIREQNDFLDSFGDLAESGKIIGEDIQNGRCTWLINKAIEKASESHLEILEENYGVKDPICIEKVMNVYKELKIAELYLEHEKLVYKQIVDEVQQLSNNEMLCFLQPLLYTLAEHVHEGKYSSF